MGLATRFLSVAFLLAAGLIPAGFLLAADFFLAGLDFLRTSFFFLPAVFFFAGFLFFALAIYGPPFEVKGYYLQGAENFPPQPTPRLSTACIPR